MKYLDPKDVHGAKAALYVEQNNVTVCTRYGLYRKMQKYEWQIVATDVSFGRVLWIQVFVIFGSMNWNCAVSNSTNCER